MVTVDDVRRVLRHLPRSEEHLIYDRVTFRVGKIVYVAFSRDETVMGFAFPKEDARCWSPRARDLPPAECLRHAVSLGSCLDGGAGQAADGGLVLDAWRMVVPKKVSAAYVAGLADRRSESS